MSTSKTAALVYDVPGAGLGWYSVAWLAGIFHPEIPVPYPKAEAYVKAQKERIDAARKDWDRFERDMEGKGFRPAGRFPFADPGVPLRLVWVTEKQAEQGLAAAKRAVQSDVMQTDIPGSGEEG